MQVDVHGVDAEVAGAHLADDGVEVGAVAVEVGAGLVHDARRSRRPRGSNRPQVLGLVSMMAATSGPSAALTAVGGDRAVVARRDRLHGVAHEGGGGRVGAVRGVGHQHDVALGALGLVRGLDGEHAGTARRARRPWATAPRAGMPVSSSR